MSAPDLALHLLLQIAVILAACHGLGHIARRLGQPQVMAEMLGGILLGPSLLGFFSPGLLVAVFPKESMPALYAIAELGLAAYMFVVGLEFRVDIMRAHLRGSSAVSAAGMIAPFILGGGAGWWFHEGTALFPAKTSLLNSALFMGACLCITAFPVLARLIASRELGATTMGTVALGAGAINDTAAWCLLAIVLASLDGHISHAFLNIGIGAVYTCFTLWVARPALASWGRGIERRGKLSESEMVLALVLMALGAWFTDLIHLHAVFGAFIMGVSMPRGLVTRSLIQRINPLTSALLLPLFFAYSGLNTRMGLLDSAGLWGAAALVLAAAIVGKGAACWAAARLSGLSQRDSLGIGTLMNVRGLMELIIINIGLQRGIISPALFAMLVITALVTTLMASPIFDWLVGGPCPASDSEIPRNSVAPFTENPPLHHPHVC